MEEVWNLLDERSPPRAEDPPPDPPTTSGQQNPFFTWLTQEDPWTVIDAEWSPERSTQVLDEFAEYARHFLAARIAAYRLASHKDPTHLAIRIEVAHE